MENVSGRRLEDAIKLLRADGFEKFNVTLTASPRLREKGYDAKSRVVRQCVSDDGTVELLVCNVNS
jgi:beta-lactam-binding protein with PASTA domain